MNTLARAYLHQFTRRFQYAACRLSSSAAKSSTTSAPPSPSTMSIQYTTQTLKSPPSSSARSIVHHPFPLTDSPIDQAQSSNQDLFAVVNFSGTQYKVVLDDMIVADKIEGIDIGQKLNLDQVLLIGSRKSTIVGRPTINGAVVVCEVEEIAKDKKVTTLKTRRRKNSKSLRGFRREVTILRVIDIIPAEDAAVL